MAVGTTYIYEEIKNLILSSNGITRKEISDKLGLDIRTVASHADKLVDSGLIRMEFGNTGKQGRPMWFYYKNTNDKYYLGVMLEIDHISYALICYPGRNIVKSDYVRIPLESKSRRAGWSSIISVLGEFIKEHRSLNICGIGFCISRWLQPPLFGLNAYQEDFIEAIKREFSIDAYSSTAVSAYTFKVQELFPETRRLVVLHLGYILELGMVLEGEVPKNIIDIEYQFSHIQVDTEGERCYCGKRGCIESYVTKGAIKDRLEALGMPMEFVKFRQQLERHDANLFPFAEKVSNFLGVAVKHLVDQYKLDCVILKDCPRIFCDYMRQGYLKAGGKPDVFMESIYLYENDLLVGTAAMAAGTRLEVASSVLTQSAWKE